MDSCIRKLHAMAEELVTTRVAPNVAMGFTVKRQGNWQLFVGGESDTLFDLASVTKPITAVAFARSGIDRRESLSSQLPDMKGTHAEDAPLELLLAHRAGLVPHLRLYEPLVTGEPLDRNQALRSAANSREAGLGARESAPLYSDMGYALVGEVLARRMGSGHLDGVFQKHVLDPLGVGSELGPANRFASDKCAPTEDVPWRGGVIRGEVHDENAWALNRLESSGHAGMFGTVGAVLQFGAAVCDGLGGFGAFGDSDLKWLVCERTGGTLRAGFDGKSGSESSAGAVCGRQTFGHLGFTGTSLWIDPQARVVTVLLTNRVCPTRENLLIRQARPKIHDELFRLGGDVG